MPHWDKVFYKTKGSSSQNTNLSRGSNIVSGNNPGLFIIPFQAQNSTKIQSYIIAYKHNDSSYSYRLYNRDVLNSISPTSESKKKELRNSQSIIAYFEKSINNVDSIKVPNTQNTYAVIKNPTLNFVETPNVSNSQSAWVCLFTITIYTGYDVIIYYTNNFPTAIFWSTVIYLEITIECWDNGLPEPGSGTSGSPSNPNNGPTGTGNGSSWPSGSGTTNGGGGTSGTGGTSTGGTGTGHTGSGGVSTGGPFYPWWDGNDQMVGVGFSPNVISLTNTLGLSTVQSEWLQNNSYHAYTLVNYLQTTSSTQPTTTAYTHLTRLMDSDPSDVKSYAQFVYDYHNSSSSNLMWWENATFLADYGGLSFGSWAINYLAQNPNVNFEVFRKQFMSKKEGEDGIYDPVYWDNPALSFPPQTLPNWASFKTVFPKHDDPLLKEPVQIYNLVGGDVLALFNTNPPKFQNTCALRISRALNYSIPNPTIPITQPITIPNIPGQTFKGGDNKYYFLSAAALKKWMIKTFGMPTGTNRLTGAQGGPNGENFPDLLDGKKGIYIMTPNYSSNAYFGASGHADMIENGICDGECYFNGSAWGGIDEILIWELP